MTADASIHTTPAAFRRRLLDALRSARAHWPGAKLYLLYAPGAEDPLGIARGDEPPRRVTATVAWAVSVDTGAHAYPRVVELDCRRVAPYLLENDPALDDSLLEDTISLAYQEVWGLTREPGGIHTPSRSLCGWLASPDPAAAIAHHLAEASERLDPATGRRAWLRWHDPRTMALLWPGMTDVQRTALLGPRLNWLATDAAGDFMEFSSTAGGAGATSGQAPRLSLSAGQWAAMHQLGLVNHLVELWRRQRGRPLPAQATEVVQREVQRASAWGLDGRDAQVFVLMAVGLRHGFEQDAALRRALDSAARHPGILADLIEELPAEFWSRYANGL